MDCAIESGPSTVTSLQFTSGLAFASDFHCAKGET